MPQSELVGKLVAALSKAQSKYTKLGKDKTGREGNLSFKYVQLPDVLSMVRPLLNEQGVYLSQPIVKVEGVLRQTTKLQLEEEFLQSDGVVIPDINPGKELGKIITYARRIDLMPFLGLSGEDEDEDAPDLKSAQQPSQTQTGWKKPINTLTQTEDQLKASQQSTKATSFLYGNNSDPLPAEIYNDLPKQSGGLADDARQTAIEMENFKPLSESRNSEIQSRLGELVKAKTLDRRKLQTFLDKEHDGKRSIDVSADRWEQTIGKIEEAITTGPDAVKALLKVEKNG